jgi:CMP/dCMP kinase
VDQADVITIDGPSASGKGTVAQQVAERLGFHFLDSGAMYRATAYAASLAGIDLGAAAAHAQEIAQVASSMDLHFADGGILLDNQEVGHHLRSEACGGEASKIAALPAVRIALLQRQRDFRRPPGLVADGRDMGSVVFPDAALKIFLTAGVEERARRRAAQLNARGIWPDDPKGLIDKENSGNISALFESVLKDLRDRDARDSQRAVAPMAKLKEARLLDTTAMSVKQAVEQVLAWYREQRAAV